MEIRERTQKGSFVLFRQARGNYTNTVRNVNHRKDGYNGSYFPRGSSRIKGRTT